MLRTPVEHRPTFSIVIPTYNRARFVLEAIRSVVEQTYTRHEIIVVVDGSNDSTANEIRQKFPQVVVIEQENFGPGVARNAGTAAASNEWICFLDDDDLWHREKLRTVADFISSHPQARAINHPIWYFAETASENGPAPGLFPRDFVAASLEQCHQVAEGMNQRLEQFECLRIHGNSLAALLENSRLKTSSLIIDKSLLIQAGGFPPIESGQDWIMSINVARMCEWHTIPQRLSFCRLHEMQLTNCNGERNAVSQIAGLISVWYGGRPFREQLAGAEIASKLVAYSSTYRIFLQSVFWELIHKGQLASALRVADLARFLLPRIIDRIFVVTPPQITWRAERMIESLLSRAKRPTLVSEALTVSQDYHRLPQAVTTD